MISLFRLTVAGLTAGWLCAGSAAVEVALGETVFTVPDGFTVERVAGPPLVDRPITAAFDEQGRLYVADSSGSNDPVKKQLAEKPHRIVRLEDRDGDGRFDHSVVFADKMMFPEGTLWHDGSLYVAAPPSIWRLTDTDGDGVVDEREEWFEATLTGCANDLHGPYLGRDGWIYWCKGAFAEQRYAAFRGAERVTSAAHIFRRHPSGGSHEPVMTGGMDNPVDVVFTPAGERIFTTTFLQYPAGGRRDGLIHAIYGGVYGKRHGVLNNHPRTGELMPVLAHLGPAAPCGLELYESAVFGHGFTGNLFSCQFNLNRVQRHELIPDDSTFRTVDSDFLATTNADFHPTDVLEDADGSLLVLDTGGWYKLCCPTSQFWRPEILGAIYRVKKTGAKPPADPRGERLKWANTAVERLVTRLDDVRPVVRRRAIAALGKRGVAAVPALAKRLRRGSVPGRQNAVWALSRIEGDGARRATRAALADMASDVQQAAAHSAGLHRDTGAVDGLIRLLRAATPPVCRAAAEALGRIGSSRAVAPLLALADEPMDRALEHSVTYALIEIGQPDAVPLTRLAKRPGALRVALTALDQMEGGRLAAADVLPLLKSHDAKLRGAAEWICDRHPEWGEALAAHYAGALSAVGTAAESEALAVRLAKLATAPAIQSILANGVGDASQSKRSRLTGLAAMAAAPVNPAPVAWLDAIDAISPPLQPVAVQTLVTLRLAKAQQERAAAMLRRLGRSAALPDRQRTLAYSGIIAGLFAPDEAEFDYLLGQIDTDKPFTQRSNAAKALAGASLSAGQLARLASQIGRVAPAEAAALLPAFGRGRDASLGQALLAVLRQASWLRGLDAAVLQKATVGYGKTVQGQAAGLLAKAKAAPADQAKRLRELADELPVGDALRGKAVFRGPKAGCSTCHSMAYHGGNLGPDLTRIGQVRKRMDLLEAIVFPSASFVRSFETMQVNTDDDGVLAGIIRDQDAGQITLALSPEKSMRVPRGNIRHMEPMPVSLMPPGMDQVLTRKELADLIAYLEASQ
ncbi:MAG: HEAT repeat domain-containing protein [Verrucomicrobiota bacterium]|nr:HEAT repeat domain-containing protein [Verrucomicrobiota bacterium]MDP6754204.1 HEAT repeat domain-containing protein [Verrucomicrobiota bacterium]